MADRVVTQLRGESSADCVRRMGWTVGTRLVGDEGYGPTVISITAIGEVNVLASRESHNGKPNFGESSWTFSYRDWQPARTPTRDTNQEGTK